MARGKWSILVAFFVLLISMEASIAQGQGNGNGNGNNGNGNGNGNNGKGKEKAKEPKRKTPKDDESAMSEKLPALQSGQERAFCKAKNTCQFKTLVCPEECKVRKPKKNKKGKGCFLDCSSKCEATCKGKFTYIYIHIYIYSSIKPDLYDWIKIVRLMLRLYILDLTYPDPRDNVKYIIFSSHAIP